MEAITIRTEYLDHPLGIEERSPRITWADVGGKAQTAYRLTYAKNGGEKKTIEVETSSMHLDFPETLFSRDEVSFTLTLRDEKGEWGKESETHGFTIGLLHPDDFHAKWISGNYHVSKKERYPADYFRKVFDVPEIPKKAYLYVSACGVLSVYLNGKRISDPLLPGSAEYRKRMPYAVYDVKTDLKPGENELVFVLGDGWYRGSIGAKGRRNVFGKETRVYGQLEYETAKGKKEILTDDSWDWSNDGPIRFNDLKDGEVVDLRFTPSFQKKAKVCSYLEPCFSAWENVRPIEIDEGEPLEIQEIEKGDYVVKFKKNTTGYISLSLEAKGNETVDVRMGEILDSNGHVTLKNVQCVYHGKKSPLQELHLALKPGKNEYRPLFYFGGFQYAEIKTALPLKKENIHQISLHSNIASVSAFECDNPLINTFVQNTRNSLLSNSLDIPTDCPTRERMGWTGDSQVFFKTASYLCDYAAFTKKHLQDVFDEQSRSGKLPQIAPYSAQDWYMRPMDGSSGWADVGILTPYRFYRQYGDDRLLKKYWPNIVRYTRFLMSRCGKVGAPYSKYTHLHGKNRRYLVNWGQSYGEWAEPKDVCEFHWYDFASPHPEVSTAYTCWMLSLVLKIAEILGLPEDPFLDQVKRFEEGTKRAYQALRKTKAYPLDTDRQANLVRPLYLHLLEPGEEAYAKKRLVEALDHYDWRVGTGFLSTPFILYVLSGIDPDYAYRLLENEKEPGWLYMAIHNTGTVWEGWEGPNSQAGIASLNHYSKGAMVEWLFDGMAGIQIKQENEFVLKPILSMLSKENAVSATYQSIYGEVALSWKKDGENVSFTIDVPSNTKATFIFHEESLLLEPGHYAFERPLQEEE